LHEGGFGLTDRDGVTILHWKVKKAEEFQLQKVIVRGECDQKHNAIPYYQIRQDCIGSMTSNKLTDDTLAVTRPAVSSCGMDNVAC